MAWQLLHNRGQEVVGAKRGAPGRIPGPEGGRLAWFGRVEDPLAEGVDVTGRLAHSGEVGGVGPALGVVVGDLGAVSVSVPSSPSSHQ